MADGPEIRSLPAELRADVSGETPRLVGYAIVADVLSEDLGGFRETITAGAIRAALAASDDIVALRDHRDSRVLGRTSAGTLQLAADARGLHFDLRPPSHAADLVESVQRGDLRHASFGFSDAVDTWDMRATPPVRTVTAMNLREISIGVPWAAYPQTTVAALRSLDAARAKETTMPESATATVTAPEPTPPVPPVVTETRDVDVVGEDRVLKPADSFRAWTERQGKADPTYRALGFGALLRAMVTTPRSDLERRALAEGSDSAGGITVPEITLSRWIDRLRAAMVVMRAGAVTVPLTTDSTTIARLLTDPTVAWRNENAEITASDPTFGGVTFVPRSLAALVRVSRELLEDSLNVEQMLERAFAESMAVELDRVALVGTGTAPEPRGIANTVGINTIALAGSLDDYDPLIDAMSACWVRNVPNVGAFALHPREAATMAKFKEGTTNAPLPKPPALDGVALLPTTSLSITEAPGTASRIIGGDFSRLMIGMRASLRVELLRERYGEFLQYGFLAHLRADVAVEDPAAFTQITGIVPA
jgi:HK97 family phage major capsid protein/HK97 family phage prohead protease